MDDGAFSFRHGRVLSRVSQSGGGPAALLARLQRNRRNGRPGGGPRADSPAAIHPRQRLKTTSRHRLETLLRRSIWIAALRQTATPFLGSCSILDGQSIEGPGYFGGHATELLQRLPIIRYCFGSYTDPRESAARSCRFPVATFPSGNWDQGESHGSRVRTGFLGSIHQRFGDAFRLWQDGRSYRGEWRPLDDGEQEFVNGVF